jgi:hypothetical protein
MALSLCPTGLAPPAHADRPDYLVIENNETIGRIYDEGKYVPTDIRWFWSITAFHIAPALEITTNGRVPSLDEAKAQFRATWDKVRAEYNQKAAAGRV